MITTKRVIKEKIDNIEFRVLSPELIKKMSVVKIITPELYDTDGYPVEGGLMNLRLGVIEPGLRCRTCGARVKQCPGHFGYIELARPVLHIRFVKKIYDCLRATCSECGRICLDNETMDEYKKEMKKMKKQRTELKYWSIAKKAIKKSRRAKECPFCGAKRKKIKLKRPSSFYDGKVRITPIDIKEWLQKIPDDDCELLGIDALGGRPEWMVLTVLPVPSVTVRPSITLESGQKSEDDLTHKLSDIVRTNQRLLENLNAGAPEIIIEDLWDLLQYHVTTYFHNGISQIPPARHRSGRPLKTLADRIKGKEGRFRKNLAGKRVNFSSRSVITPDPNININEVGFPKELVKGVTIPERVNNLNKKWLKKLINNYPEYPCALYVLTPDGRRKKITDETKDFILEELDDGFIVERNMINGDVVLFNRQPSLHRMSIMAHYVKVLPYKTFRLNLTVTPPYNADFDGDEMNIHIPQTEEARAEAEELLEVSTQVISPRLGLPIIGCKQDHITGNFLLTRRDTKLSREQAFQLLTSIGRYDYELKFDKDGMTDGKQVFSATLPEGLNFEIKSSFCKRCKTCDREECEIDAFVKVVDGELISGVIDDKSIGAGKGLLIQEISKRYEREEVADAIQNIGLLGIKSLDMLGFTVLTSDSDLNEETVKEIKKTLNYSRNYVNKIIEDYDNRELVALPGRTLRETVEQRIINVLNRARNKTGVLVMKNKSNKINYTTIMARSGAKGNMLNLAQIAGCVGQQVLRGSRIIKGYEDRSLPHFKKGDLSAEPHGFIRHGYKAGLEPHEFFFKAITGRDATMDTSMRTPKSGYFQRRLINALQDLKVERDETVRSSRDSIIQLKYGEDGVDVSKSDAGSIDIDMIITDVMSSEES